MSLGVTLAHHLQRASADHKSQILEKMMLCHSWWSCCINFFLSVSRSVVSGSLWPHGLLPARLFYPWHSPGKDTGVGCHFLCQVIFPTQGSNPGLLHCRRTPSPSDPPGKDTSYHLGHFYCAAGSAGKESACHARDPGSIPGLGRRSGEGRGYPLQYSGLENSMDCIVYGVTKSQTRVSDFHFQ